MQGRREEKFVYYNKISFKSSLFSLFKGKNKLFAGKHEKKQAHKTEQKMFFSFLFLFFSQK